MTAGDARAGEIFVDDLVIAHRSKAWKMAAMDNRNREIPQSLQACPVIGTIGMISIINERAVVDDVSRQQNTRLGLEQRNAARRMSRGVYDFEGAVAEIDPVTMGQQGRGRCRRDTIGGRIPSARLTV